MATTYLGKIVEGIKPIRVVTRSIDGKSYKIHYINDSKLRKAGFNLSGYVYKGKIYIRVGLSKRVEQGVLRHEVYHSNDSQQWLGKHGKEIRAHAHTIAHDPIGFLIVFVHSLRYGFLKTFWRLYIHPRNLN